MASVWKRLQRVNKRAAKFQYTASYHRIDLETSPKWKPNKLSIVWTRRSRRVVTEPVEWEPSLKDPLKGSVIFTAPENQTVAVTLFKDSRTNELEDKDWTFVLEDVSMTGKRRRLAICALNMRRYASLEPSQRALVVTLEPTSRKVAAASLHLTLHAVLLREGQATDEDMQSLASLLSVNNNSDIAVLEDLDEDDYTLSDQSTKQMSSLRHQMEEMTQSLTNSDIAATPNSVQSLNFDSRTPTAPITPVLTPTTPVPNDPSPTINDREIKTSTPKNVFEKDLKGVVFKPKTVAKRSLKPLELKTNLCNITLDGNENEKEEDTDKTPTGEVEKLFPGRLNADKTPVQDLLEWCQTATREYRACRVTNLTTSFRSGLAFCAIIHYYRPDLIDFSGLQPEESEKNVRVALEASAKLGIAQVLAARDVCVPAPDRLAIMTYLFQLRAHFTGSELQVEQLGNSECESSYLVGRHDTDDGVPRELFSREVATRRSARQARPVPEVVEKRSSTERSSPDSILSPRSLLNKVLASPKDKPTARWFDDPFNINEPPSRPEKLMTRKELTDPFGSDEEDEQVNTQTINVSEKCETNTTQKQTDPLMNLPTEAASPSGPDPDRTSPSDGRTQPNTADDTRTSPKTPEPQNESPSPDLPKPTPQLLSRHDELKERARLLLEATKKEAREKENKRRQNAKEKEDKENLNGVRNGDDSPKKGQSDEERQAMLRERARKLIADARAGIVSPTSPASPSRGRAGAVEIISKQSVLDEIAAAGGIEQLDAMLLRNDSLPSSPASRKSLSPDRISGDTRPTLHSFSALLDRLTPDRDDESGECLELEAEGRGCSGFLGSELVALEREQAAVDAAAAALEKQLRAVMDNADEKEEDRLMSQWFNLVNKKNALLRRQMQLNILEQEEDLSRRCELLEQELRASLAVDEWRKTPDQKRREMLLLQELLKAVNERDRLVHEMDEQEKAIADDDEIERHITGVDLHRKNNCVLQ